MLDAHRQQALGDQLEGLAVAVQRLDPDLLRAVDVLVEAGHRQAAFLVLVHLLGERFELGVDEHPRLALVLGQVHHHQTLVHVDLGRGQADAGRRVHGLEHVVDQLAQGVVHRGHRLGEGAQAGIGEFENVQDRHMRL
ncbi:hypothetical protein D3C78_1309030 [compost metagenome]